MNSRISTVAIICSLLFASLSSHASSKTSSSENNSSPDARIASPTPKPSVEGGGVEIVLSVELAADGGFIGVGWMEDGMEAMASYMVNLDSEGDVLWEKMLGDIPAWELMSIHATLDGGHVIAGAKRGYIIVGDTESSGAGSSDVYLVKLSTDRTVISPTPTPTAQLTVISDHGNPVPSGSLEYDVGTSVNASVESEVSGEPSTKYVCSGWTLETDASTTSGFANEMSFVIDSNTTLTWLWATQYSLFVDSAFGNPVPPIGTNYIDEATTVTAHVEARTYDNDENLFVLCEGWVGGGSVPTDGDASEVTFVMDEPSTITWRWQEVLELPDWREY